MILYRKLGCRGRSDECIRDGYVEHIVKADLTTHIVSATPPSSKSGIEANKGSEHQLVYESMEQTLRTKIVIQKHPGGELNTSTAGKSSVSAVQ